MKTVGSPIRKSILTTTVLLTGAWAQGASAQEYRAIDLGTLGGPMTAGFAINDLGQAGGASVVPTANFQGLFWDGAPVSVPPRAGQSQSHAFSVNAAGVVAAVSYVLGALTTYGLLWDGGTVTDLGAFAPRGLNDAGLAVGHVSSATATIAWVAHAAKWQGGTLTDLGTLGGDFSYAAAVSAVGKVVGWSYTAGDAAVRAALWQGGAVYDLGTLGGATSQAYATNDNGQVAGVADTAAGAPHAFLFTVNAAGAVTSRTDLGVLGGGYSYAYGINNLGAVVGTSDARAFRWQAGTMVDLNTLLPANSGWQLESARAINLGGQIVGTGTHLGFPHGFLFTRSGDLTADGAVDLTDWSGFTFCFGGPGVTTVPPACTPYDFVMSDIDGDGDADMADFAVFQGVFLAP
jgi:probable HAF family extracellular repeat protein